MGIAGRRRRKSDQFNEWPFGSQHFEISFEFVFYEATGEEDGFDRVSS